MLFAAHINEVKPSGHLMNSKQAPGGDHPMPGALSSVKELSLGYLISSIYVSSVQKATISSNLIWKTASQKINDYKQLLVKLLAARGFINKSPHAHTTDSTQSRLADEEQCLPRLTKAQTGHSEGLKTIKNLQVFSLWKTKLDIVSPY